MSEPLTFRPRHRLTHAREFDAVYDARVRKNRGPLWVFTRPNGLSHHRLGLAVRARLGGAVLRNRLKRLVRESFRLDQYVLARIGNNAADGGMDIIVSVRGREVLPLTAYRQLLRELVEQAAQEWGQRHRATSPATPPPPDQPTPES